ncbi:MAG: PD-(D/E)XK nuclease family protein [Sphaerochaeta sp.]
MTKREYVQRALESGAICVFPTEAAARSALIDYALHSDCGTILASRAISFDTFRGRFLAHSEELIPSNTLLRQLFVHRLIEDGPPLSQFLNPRFPEANRRLERAIATMLPALEGIVGDQELFGSLEERMRGDIQLLHQHYHRFLDEHNLFEPQYEKPSLPNDWDAEQRFIILYSDAIAQAGGLHQTLGEPSNIELWPTPEVELSLLDVYPNHIQEVRSTLRKIRALMLDGVEIHQIAIGCAASETLIPVLTAEARLYDVPLSIREGKSPLLFPGGSFLLRLSEVYDESFTLESLKSLLLDPSIPWKDEQRARDFIFRAVEQSIFEGSVRGADQFIERLQDRELVSWYQALKGAIIGIVEAADIEALRSSLNYFQDTYFLSQQWKGREGEQVYSFCLDAIGELDRALMHGGVKTHHQLFGWLITLLRAKRYVFQQADEGIAVYGWPQISTLLFDHLFVIGLDEQSSAVVDRPFSFLGEAGEKHEIETTAANYRAASLQCSTVTLSCHLRRYEGQMLPPPQFFETDRLRQLDGPLMQESDPYLAELALWRDEGGQGPPPTASQRAWFSYAEQTSLAIRAIDYTRKPVPPLFIEHLKREYQGLLVLFLSATKIDLFSRCPYAFLARYLLGVDSKEWEPQRIDHRLIGTLQHQVYQRFFSEIRRFEGAKISEYEKQLLELFDQVLVAVFGERGPTPSIRAWIIAAHRQAMVAILEQEELLFDNTLSVGFEQGFEVLEDERLLLNGKIDRIIEIEEGRFAVIDYKKGDAPMIKLTDPPQSYQLPLYQHFIQEEMGSCANASYYSIKEGRYRSLWESEESEAAQLAADLLQKRLSSLDEAVEAGALQVTPSKKACEKCVYRPLCRRRYAAP